MTSRPVYSVQEARFRKTFSALMWALSHPGRTQVLSPSELTGGSHSNVFVAIAETLISLETSNPSYFTSDAALAAYLKFTTARALPANRAAYHFYPTVSDADVYYMESSRGSPLFPDQPVTLCLGCTQGSMNGRFAKSALTLHIPGQHVSFSFSGIPGEIWMLREERNVYPIGWDIFLIDADGKLISIPRNIGIQIERLAE